MKKIIATLIVFFLFIDFSFCAPPTVCLVMTEPNNHLMIKRVDCDPMIPPYTNKTTLYVLKNLRSVGGLQIKSVGQIGNSLVFTLDNL